MNKKEIKKQVLNKITPNAEYKKNINKTIQVIIDKIKNELIKTKIPATIELVGSTAKDTYLKDDLDIDIFLVFPIDFKKEEIGKQAILIGEKILSKTEKSYAEHPYIRGQYKEFKIEIVPCYKIEKASQKLSAVDRTPLHTKYIKNNLKETQKQDVRLFKQFLKGINCYGAEAQIEGFSGYLCEIIILYYETFENTIKEASQWEKQIKLSIKKGKHPDFDTPLVFIDPVDPDRNVASALTEEKFDLFVRACKEYLKNPKNTFFFPNLVKPWTLKIIKETIKKQDCKYLGIKFGKPEIIDENLYPQIRKTARSILENLERYGFEVYDTAFFVDKKNIYIIIKTQKDALSDTMIHTGPPTTKKENIEQFLKKWKHNSLVVKGPYQKNNRLYVEIKRQYTTVETFLEKEFKKLSLGKHIDEIVSREYTILEIDSLLSEKLKVFWTSYLDSKMSWEW